MIFDFENAPVIALEPPLLTPQMDFRSKAILVFLVLCFHCTNGNLYGRHEIVRRDISTTELDRGLGGLLSKLLQPLADLADKAKVEIPLVSHFRSKHFN
ncbi:uncharacterized protein Dere_GG26648 [Drosophila erecta]|uniref:Uncharacterized protein n=1 Tax=Drosophila erecta TaxID=7220 RepID=A0A0Q5UJZ6_DROER|nr:uncharacterized protein Dere_GG26648 [Drosophila erecta]